MFKRAKYLSIPLWLALSTASFAQTPAPTNNSFQFTGAGALGCTEVMSYLANPAMAPQFQQWLLGFLAAYNAYSNPAQRVNLPQTSALLASSGEYCKANPNARYIAAAGHVLRQLGANVAPLQ